MRHPARHTPAAAQVTPPSAIAASAHDLVRTYGVGPTAVPALRGVSVAFARATFTAVMGTSGSGKSTLLHCLAGLDRPDGGRVEIAGQDLTTLDDRRLTALRRDRVGFVFQQFNLIPTLTAGQNILLPLDLGGRRPDQGRLATVLDVLGIADRLDHRPDELSGGQQQRVAVARALVGAPDVLFADEPTGALDSRSAADLLDLLRRSCEELGQSIVMVTHDPAAACCSSRVVVLSDGQVTDDVADPTHASIRTALRGAAA